MEYIELISKTTYGILWIRHSILKDKNTILSFEWGEFNIYNTSYLKERTITKSIEVPYIDLNKYKWLKLDLNCYESIEYIYTLEWIKMNTGRLRTYTIYLLLLFLSHLIFYTIWMYVGINLEDTTVSMINNFLNY